jgi:cation:H+ antiporter
MNLALFAAAAAVVWRAGTRLSAAADALAEHTGIGRAFVGALLLGGITSLPEATTTVSAIVIDNPQLAINNIIGGVAMQIVVLSLADGAIRREPLALRVDDSSVLLEATFLILVLTLAVFGLAFGDYGVLGFGLWTMAIFVCSVFVMFLLYRARSRQPWIPRKPAERPTRESRGSEQEQKHWGWALIGGSAAILAAGVVLTRSADALAAQTGLEASFIGAVALALATSLPEISTTLGAVRLKQYAMAYSNIFGANVFDLSLLFIADLVYTSGAVLDQAGRFAAGVGLLSILLTAVALAGLLERRRIVLFRLGVDSLFVAVIYIVGLAVLYSRG